MPKGVYQRKSQRMEVVVSEQAPETQPANKNEVIPIQQFAGDEILNTTERLFPDLMPANVQPEAPAPGESTPIPQEPQETPQPVVPQEPEPQEEPIVAPKVIPEGDDVDFDKKVKAVIDGKEEMVSVKELRDQYQLKKHLNQVADKVGEQRRQLAEERRQLEALRQRPYQQIPIEQPSFQQPNFQQAPQFNQAPQYQQTPQTQQDPYLQRIQFLEQQISQVAQMTQPAVYRSNRDALDQKLRSQGFNDFNDKWPQIVATVDPNLIQSLNGNEMAAAEMTYFQLKAQEANRGQVSRPPVIQAQNRPTPPVMKIDGGTQPSSGLNDDSKSQYKTAFRRATNASSDGEQREAWNEVLRQKGLIPND
jgi:hypothetical protein